MVWLVRLFIVSLVMLMSACGWQLRGAHTAQNMEVSIHVPPKEVELRRVLERELVKQGFTLTPAAASSYQVEVLSIELDERSLTQAGNLQAASKVLIVNASYRLLHSNQTTPLLLQAKAQGNFDYRSNNPAGSANELTLLRRDLNENIARQIVAQLTYQAARP